MSVSFAERFVHGKVPSCCIPSSRCLSARAALWNALISFRSLGSSRNADLLATVLNAACLLRCLPVTLLGSPILCFQGESCNCKQMCYCSWWAYSNLASVGQIKMSVRIVERRLAFLRPGWPCCCSIWVYLYRNIHTAANLQHTTGPSETLQL